MRTAIDEIMDFDLNEEVCEIMAQIITIQVNEIRANYGKSDKFRKAFKDDIEKYLDLSLYYALELVREEIKERLDKAL